MNIVQIGMGYVGLTGAVTFALKGHTVMCIDVDQKVVDAINNGNPRSGDFLAYLQTDVKRLVLSGKLFATNVYNSMKEFDAYLISVPTERKDEPYMQIVIDTVKDIVTRFSKPGKPVNIIIESTVTPGTCKIIAGLLLDKGFQVDVDYYLSVAPRRDWFASAEKSVAKLPRVVGGLTPESTRNACNVLDKICERIDPTTYDVAELTKSLENALLNVQVTLAEYLSISYPHVNVVEALRLATHGHWRLNPIFLGAGISGRCIPLAIKYLQDGISPEIPDQFFFEKLQAIDSSYRQQIVNTVLDFVEKYVPNDGAVNVLGLGYRPDFKDVGVSPGLDFYRWLKEAADYGNKNLEVNLYDPLFSAEEMEKYEVDSHDQYFSWNVLILATPHTVFSNTILNILDRKKWESNTLILDCYGEWNIYKEVFKERGITYVQVGQKDWTSLSV